MHILAEEPAAELESIWYYIAKESGSIERADRIVDAITELFYALSTYPRKGRERPDLRTGLRSFTVANHVIIYRIEPTEDVLILHVFDGRQDIQARL